MDLDEWIGRAKSESTVSLNHYNFVHARDNQILSTEQVKAFEAWLADWSLPGEYTAVALVETFVRDKMAARLTQHPADPNKYPGRLFCLKSVRSLLRDIAHLGLPTSALKALQIGVSTAPAMLTDDQRTQISGAIGLVRQQLATWNVRRGELVREEPVRETKDRVDRTVGTAVELSTEVDPSTAPVVWLAPLSQLEAVMGVPVEGEVEGAIIADIMNLLGLKAFRRPGASFHDLRLLFTFEAGDYDLRHPCLFSEAFHDCFVSYLDVDRTFGWGRTARLRRAGRGEAGEVGLPEAVAFGNFILKSTNISFHGFVDDTNLDGIGTPCPDVVMNRLSAAVA